MEKLSIFKGYKIKKYYNYITVVVRHSFGDYNEQKFEETGEKNEELSVVVDRLLQKFNEVNSQYQAKIAKYEDQKAKLEALGLGPLEFEVTHSIIYECSPPQYSTSGFMSLGKQKIEGRVSTRDKDKLKMDLCDKMYNLMIKS